MAYSLREAGRDSHNAKLKRMTMDYGSADPAMNKLARVDKFKEEGEESAVGFGAEDGAASAKRGDKPARKSAAANPVPTYATGGRVRNAGGGVGVIAGRARGGRTKGKTSVNIMIAPQSPQQPPLPALAGPPPGPPVPPMAPPTPPKSPLMAGMEGGAPGGPPGGPPGMPPMMRKRGGSVEAKLQADPTAYNMKAEGLKRAKGGKVLDDYGSVSGPGREAKNKHFAKHGDKSKQVV